MFNYTITYDTENGILHTFDSDFYINSNSKRPKPEAIADFGI